MMKKTWIRKHGVPIDVYEYNGKFYLTKEDAQKAQEK